MTYVRPTGERFDLHAGRNVYLVEWLHACLICAGNEKANLADPNSDVSLLINEMYDRADMADIEAARKADPHATWSELSTDELQAECERRQRELIELTNVIRNRLDQARAGMTRAAQIKPKTISPDTPKSFLCKHVSTRFGGLEPLRCARFAVTKSGYCIRHAPEEEL